MSYAAQTLHVLRKDVLRYWPYVVLLTVALAVDSVVDADTPTYLSGVLGRLVGGVGIRGALLALVTATLFAVVIHEDDASGRQAFWASRPLSPLAVFAAKTLFGLAFLLAIPLAFQAVAIVRIGTADGLGAHLVESALHQGALLGMVGTAAAITRDLRATIVVAVAGFVGLGVLESLLGTGAFPRDVGLDATRTLVGKAWWLAAGGALLAFQYRTGRTRLTVGGLGIAVALSTAIATALPWDFTAPPRETVPLAPAEPLSMQVQEVLFTPANRTSGSGLEGLEAVVATGPSALSLAPRMGSLELLLDRGAGGEVVRPRGRSYAPVQRYAPAMPGYRWLGRGGEWAQFDVRVVSAPSGRMNDVLTSIAEVEIRAEWDAFDQRVVGHLPVREGSELVVGSRRVRVATVENGPSEVVVRVETSSVRSLLGDRLAADRGGALRFLMVNDRTRELLLPSSGGSTGNRTQLVLGGPSGSRQTETLTYRLGRVPGTDDELHRWWFHDASLVVFTNGYVGTMRGSTRSSVADWALPAHVGVRTPPATSTRVASNRSSSGH